MPKFSLRACMTCRCCSIRRK